MVGQSRGGGPGAGPTEAREIARIDPERCDGCGQCLPNCAEGAISISGGKAVLSDSLCDGLGNCLAHCPKGALEIVYRKAVAFDHEAAMAIMRERAAGGVAAGQAPGPSIPTASPARPIIPAASGASEGLCPGSAPAAGGRLANWPIQLALVPPKAPQLDSEVLVFAADCVAAAADGFRELLGGGRPLVLGCPKLDDKSLYEIKIGVILASAPKIRELWLPIMSVPCCRGLWRLAKAGLARSSRSDVALKGWVFSPDGQALEREVAIGGE